MPVADDERLGIQSVEIAARILRAVSDAGGLLQLPEISKATGMHRGKVHRYITSLARSGLLRKEPDSGAYGVGPLAISLGLVGLRRINPIRIAYRELPGLSETVNETAVISIWGEMGATVVALEESSRPITLNVRVGSILPIQTSAMGKIFEAFLPSGITAPAIAREAASTLPLADQSGHESMLENIRQCHLSHVLGTVLPGINALAAPIFDRDQKLCLVVGLVGRQESLDVAEGSQAALQIRAFADRISAALGADAREIQTGGTAK